MLYPTISELTKDEFNRYELALATAKCARIITDEYVSQRAAAEEAANGNKEVERNLMNMIDKDYRDEKAVKNSINKINNGEYKIVRSDVAVLENDELIELNATATEDENA